MYNKCIMLFLQFANFNRLGLITGSKLYHNFYEEEKWDICCAGLLQGSSLFLSTILTALYHPHRCVEINAVLPIDYSRVTNEPKPKANGTNLMSTDGIRVNYFKFS